MFSLTLTILAPVSVAASYKQMPLGVEVWGFLWGDGIFIEGHFYLPLDLLTAIRHPFLLQH